MSVSFQLRLGFIAYMDNMVPLENILSVGWTLHPPPLRQGRGLVRAYMDYMVPPEIILSVGWTTPPPCLDPHTDREGGWSEPIWTIWSHQKSSCPWAGPTPPPCLDPHTDRGGEVRAFMDNMVPPEIILTVGRGSVDQSCTAARGHVIPCQYTLEIPKKRRYFQKDSLNKPLYLCPSCPCFHKLPCYPCYCLLDIPDIESPKESEIIPTFF